MALNPGHTLSNGHYRIQRLLGRGGYGFVYLAQDTLLGEEVAIKELIPALVGDDVMLKRFLAEAKATMRLTHKHIVRTHNVFSEDGNYYIVMEYMPGGSLEERLQAHGALPVDEAVGVAAEVCEGLACAHEEGVVHCDLKPHNILFDARGLAKVADFGIAHVSAEMLTRSWHTPAGFVAGTLPYMSPEQAEGVRDDPRVDVYALGAVLYRMLAGRTYLDFDPRETPRSQSENVQRIFEDQPRPPSAHNQGIPTWLDGVVLKALAKRPEARYADAEAMGAALQQGRPVLSLTSAAARATAPRPRTRAVRKGRKRAPLPVWFSPVAAGAGILLVVLVIAIAALLGGGDGRETAVPQPTEMAVPAVTPAPPLSANHTPTLPTMPTGTDTPRPTATATDTPKPTATRTLRPTDTPRPPTTTYTPQPTATLPPTPTPTPRLPQAGETQTWSKNGAVMVYVPAGTFWMGSTDKDIDAILAECSICQREWYTNEQPQHEIRLDAFWIDRAEVTNAQYRNCVDEGACSPPSSPSSWTRDSYHGASELDNYPVLYVDWAQANAYCTWAGVRLPTEAEWEKAAKGTDRRIYPWGSVFDGSLANFCDANCEFDWKNEDWDDGHADTAPVGNYPGGASPYGVLDMAGNAWEWVADWYGGDYYVNSPERNPQGPNSGSARVARGGSWNFNQGSARAARRLDLEPSSSLAYVGFRCALSGSEP